MSFSPFWSHFDQYFPIDNFLNVGINCFIWFWNLMVHNTLVAHPYAENYPANWGVDKWVFGKFTWNPRKTPFWSHQMNSALTFSQGDSHFQSMLMVTLGQLLIFCVSIYKLYPFFVSSHEPMLLNLFSSYRKHSAADWLWSLAYNPFTLPSHLVDHLCRKWYWLSDTSPAHLEELCRIEWPQIDVLPCRYTEVDLDSYGSKAAATLRIHVILFIDNLGVKFSL